MTKIVVIGNGGEYSDHHTESAALVADGFDMEKVVKEYVSENVQRLVAYELTPKTPTNYHHRPFKVILDRTNAEEIDRYFNVLYGGHNHTELPIEELPFHVLSNFVGYKEMKEFVKFCRRKNYFIKFWGEDELIFWR